MTTPTPLLDTALKLRELGISTIPTKPTDPKRPTIRWKKYAEQLPTVEELEAWFHPSFTGGIAGIMGGQNHHVMIEFEGKSVTKGDLETLKNAATNNPHMANLWDRFTNTWTEKSPSGGIHYFIQITGIDQTPGNTKLAANLDGEVLAETRGSHGYSIMAPTCANNQRWEAIANHGKPATFTVTEYAEICRHITSTIDEVNFNSPKPTPQQPQQIRPVPSTTPNNSKKGLAPGTDFNNTATWEDILIPHGWAKTHQDTDGTQYWRRPGKTDQGDSATTGHSDDGQDRLYVFSTNTPFEPETPYSKFAAYTILNHGPISNAAFKAAAKDLARQGYGDQHEDAILEFDPNPRLYPIDGNTAINPEPATLLPTIDKSQDSLATYIAAVHSHHIRYVADTGKWVYYTGTRWEEQPDTAGAVTQIVKNELITLTKQITAKADNEQGAKKDETLKLRGFVHRQRSRAGITSILSLMTTIPGIAHLSNDFDTNPFLLNTPGGTIDLRTGALKPHNPDDLITQQTLVTPDFTSQHPGWDTFLKTTFKHDPEIPPYLQTLIGMAAIGEIFEHIFVFAHGAGANGKSVFFETIHRLLGNYAAITPPTLFIKTYGNQHPTESARLQGKRFVLSQEIDPHATLDEAKLKSLTGGDTITTRRMYKDYFEYQPVFTPFLAANDQPRIQSGGLSMWRRINLIPFTTTIPKKDRIPNLTNILIDKEGPQILAWIIRGAQKYLTDGLNPPKSVTEATRKYEKQEDHIGRFIDDCCTITPSTPSGGRTPIKEMRTAYTTWCEEEGLKPLTAKDFNRKLEEKYNVEQKRTDSYRYFAGIELNAEHQQATNDFDTPWNDLGGER